MSLTLEIIYQMRRVVNIVSYLDPSYRVNKRNMKKIVSSVRLLTKRYERQRRINSKQMKIHRRYPSFGYPDVIGKKFTFYVEVLEVEKSGRVRFRDYQLFAKLGLGYTDSLYFNGIVEISRHIAMSLKKAQRVELTGILSHIRFTGDGYEETQYAGGDRYSHFFTDVRFQNEGAGDAKFGCW